MERAERLATCERLMGRTFSRRRVEQEFCKIYGCDASTARRYIRAVRKQWAIDAATDRNKVRAELRAKMQELLEMALTRTRPVVIQASANEQTVEMVEDPDLKAAAAILHRLAELEGVYAPQQHEVAVVPPPMPVKVIDTTEAKSRLRLLKSGGEEE